MKTNYAIARLNLPKLELHLAFLLMLLLAGLNAVAQCNGGNTNQYPVNSWKGYVYSGLDGNNPPQNAFNANSYKGYVTQDEQFDWNLGTGSVSGSNVCGSIAESFSIRYRMKKNFSAGFYQITVGGDDGYRFSIDSGNSWVVSDWNYHVYQTTTVTLYLSGMTEMVLETYDQGGEYRASFSYSSCGNVTKPTSVSGSSSVCAGSPITLTANGGNGSLYQWGTGNVVGNNIIAGETGQSITVNPMANTTYWVRRQSPAPCNGFTDGVTKTVTVIAASTAPTSIAGIGSICSGASLTLTATGGTHVAGSTYQWGTGTVVGNNIIAGETGASITVSPSATTTYWVRRKNSGSCGNTAAATGTVTVTSIGGDQTSYGNNSWIGYVYTGMDGANPPNNPWVDYKGYITQPETFDYNLGTGALSGQNVCGSLPINFAIRFKMRKNWTAGYYRFTVGGDDGYRFSIDGGQTWILSNWNDHAYDSSQTAPIYLSGNKDFVIEFYERQGETRVTFNYTSCVNSTAPTSITGNTTICSGAWTTLTATGGTMAPGAVYQWGTGTVVGNNVMTGQTGASISVNPYTNTTYWVRRVDGNPCAQTTAGVTQLVTVNTVSTQPTGISSSAGTTICSGNSVTLTANGGTMGTGAVYNWGTGYTVGQNVIAGQTGQSITVSPTSQTVYWVRRVDSCTQTSGATITINVNGISTAPTSFTASTTSSCPGQQVTLIANGATLANNGQYQFGTGSVAGQNIIANLNGNTFNVSPWTSTQYWVRTTDNACGQVSSALFLTVTVNTSSTQPTGITGTNTICPGESTTLTATGGTMGSNAVYQWGTGNAPNNIIAGQTGASITVSPSATTTYWVRRIDSGCNNTTGAATRVVTVTALATAPTSISGAPATAVCVGQSFTLTANGGSGTYYQWGTGTAPNNVISGANGQTLTVTPSATTTYWVRRYTATCDTYTNAVSTTVNVTVPTGDPGVFGSGQWNVYGYTAGDINLNNTAYAGYYVSTALNIDTPALWNANASPSSAPGYVGCPIPNDNFLFVYKRKDFPCGTYTLNVNSWDDEIRVFVNGNLVFSCNNWSGGGGCNNGVIPGSFNLDENSQIEVRVREYGGDANVRLNFTKIDTAPTAPTTIAGANSTCPGSAITLTASGGTIGTNGIYEWGTGTPGQNIISGQTSASISVSPTVATTYWVRRKNQLCGTVTAAVTKTVTVNPASVAGTLICPSTVICRNSIPQNIELTGHSGSVVKWQYASNAAFTQNLTDIANTSTVLTGAQIGPIPATRYFRAVVQNGSCPAVYTDPAVITILPTITYNGTWSGTPSALTSIVVSANLTLNSDITACSCQITNNAVVNVQPGVTLTVDREIVVDEGSNIIVENTGSIVQIQDDAANIGLATVKRSSSPMKGFDFTYWSSPVQNQTLYNLSPNTRFDKYYWFDPITNNWIISMNGAAVMQAGRGYIVRAPDNWSLTNATQGVYHASFIGTPNTGVVEVPFQKGAGSFNLLGNPYPSAIDIDLFLTDPANENIVNGTVYLWTHNTAISSSIPGNSQYNYAADDYAKYNLTGGIKTANPALTGGVEPNGKIASGQAFFIDSATGLANGNYTATFRNSMRVAGQNDQFYRPASSEQPMSVATGTGLEKHRAWINIHNSVGAYDEMLIGYIQNATNGFDRLFDGEVFNGGNNVSLYTILGNRKLAIQGRAFPFDPSDVIPVGFKTSTSGSFTIELEHFDGLFENQNVYLLDKTDMSYHNLSEAPYTFTTAIGVVENRFEIHFTNSSLGVDPVVSENSVYIVKNGDRIEASSGNFIMESLQVFDLTGKKVYEKDGINASLFSTKDFNVASQVLIVKVKLDNDAVITKKIVM